MDRKFSLFIVVLFICMCISHFNINLENLYKMGSKLIFCPFKELTGLPCPGCGMTRAFWLLSEFKIKKALMLNPFSIYQILGLYLSF